MFWDITIAAGAALAQLLTAFLGLRLAMKPIDPNDPKQKTRLAIYQGLFVIVGLAGVALVGLAAYRTPRERAHLAVPSPGVTYQEAGIIPSWLNGAPFLQINRPLAFNISYQEVGSGSAINVMNRMHTFIEPNQSETSENDVLAQFEKMKATEPLAGSFTLAKGASEFNTARRMRPFKLYHYPRLTERPIAAYRITL